MIQQYLLLKETEEMRYFDSINIDLIKIQKSLFENNLF